jgi:hypothetical protein
VVEQEKDILLPFPLATGKVNLIGVLDRLQGLRDPVMVRVLEMVPVGPDDLVRKRLSKTYPSESRIGTGLASDDRGCLSPIAGPA